jgi:ABC-2 type transport system ATP-binding protein
MSLAMRARVTELAATSAEARGDTTAPATSREAVITVRGLRKRYAAVEAVAGIDLEVRRGEIFAFLGPNGAGKTTTVEILDGFRTRSDGEVSVLGVDPDHADSEWRNRVGCVLQESSAEPGLTSRRTRTLDQSHCRRPRLGRPG